MEDHYWWFAAKRALVRLLLDAYAPLPAALGVDVGCGTGGTIQALSAPGGRWVGTDQSGLALMFCRKRGLPRLLQASAEALPFRSESADLVLCLDVLYHRGVADDGRVLAECFRILRPGGTVVITDSALDWLRGPHDEAVHTRRRYRLGEMVTLVGAARFQILRRSYANTLLLPPTAAYRIARRWLPGRESSSDIVRLPRLVERMLAGIMALERWLIKRFDLPFGSSVVLVGRKP